MMIHLNVECKTRRFESVIHLKKLRWLGNYRGEERKAIKKNKMKTRKTNNPKKPDNSKREIWSSNDTIQNKNKMKQKDTIYVDTQLYFFFHEKYQKQIEV